jgi:hypothetical protein
MIGLALLLSWASSHRPLGLTLVGTADLATTITWRRRKHVRRR